ncbi:hypothetical protein A8B82_08430 [Sulfitobacter sp. EhC04]|nr:hypothetical protein A8B82_08430 [Sulfitobacter sp. EhC04]
MPLTEKWSCSLVPRLIKSVEEDTMTQTRYRHVLRITTKHAYYGDQLASVFSIAPVADTAAGIARAGLVARQTSDSLDIFADERVYDDGELAVQSLFEIALPLDFYQATDPDWRGELEADALLFLTDFQSGGEGSTLWIASDGGTALPTRGYRFQQPLEAAFDSAPPQLLTWQDRASIWQGVVSEPGATSLDISVPGAPEGRYLLSHNGKTLLDFFLTPRPQTRCVLELNLKALLAQADHGLVTVRPSFGARACRWRYVVSPLSFDRDLSAATVTAKPGGPTFTGPAKEMQNGVPNWVFTSNGPISLSGVSGTKHDIRCNLPEYQGRPETSVLCPIANAASFGHHPDGETFFATMYLEV